jgi:lysophospholipase L1-like esterase
MKSPTAKERSFITFGYLLVITGQLLFFIGLIFHQPKFERFIGPGPTTLLLGVALLLGLVPVALLLWRRNRLPDILGRMIQRLGRFPLALLLLLFFGAATLFALLFFYALIALFFSLPIFIAALLAANTGFILLLAAALPAAQFRRLRQQLVLLMAGILLGLFIIEIALRFLDPYPLYTILPANAHWELHPTPEVLPGIHDTSLYTTNAVGIRGEAYQADGHYNILAIGGSTTETAFLDDAETWTHLLQASLNQENGRPPNLDPGNSVWVGNVGRSGHGLVEHIHALQYFVPQYRFDAVILLVGINDFMPVIQNPDQYNDQYEDPSNYPFFLHRSFYTYPLVDTGMPRSFPENTAVWNLTYMSVWNILNAVPTELTIEFPDARSYLARRENYLAAPVLPSLPDLSSALTQYKENLLRLVALAKEQDIRLLFATQPAIWHENISPEMVRLLWFGYRGDPENPNGRYAPQDLQAGMDQFNHLLLEVCREQGVECIDLAAEMTGHESYFYDDVHFNEAGSEKVAAILADYIQKNRISRD